MSKGLEFNGTVVDSNKGKFTVKISDTHSAICTLSGKIRMSAIKILVGDSVVVEISEYDTGKGRIVYRNKN